ncbi:hypothetical protein TrST_g8759 [Triparma strigata]|uniref:Uncharacterized protein n=1 Tax=Triparma strigata TaxID=1606541 RepID=A0A9W7E3I2_9STRA|nr:hypothetical protein TrST_g8759 [Triparma strigata]
MPPSPTSQAAAPSHEEAKAILEQSRSAMSSTKNFIQPVKKLTIAEEVGKKLKRMEDKPLKDFLDIALREFDLAVSLQVSEMRETFDDALDELRTNCDSVENNLTHLLKWKEETCQKRVKQAIGQRDQERKEKLSLAKWMKEFTPSKYATTQTDEVDFAFIRFALNMAIACDVCPVQKQLDAGAPAFLASMLTVKNDCVVGPASMALAHLSLHVECKAPIAAAGGIVACVNLVNDNPNAPIVSQACKTLASVAMWPANKPLMAGKGAIKALVRAVQSVGPDNERIDDDALGSAFCGLCNCAEGNDANRNLIVELDVMKSVEYICENWTDPYVLASAAKLICNLAYSNVYTAMSCLSSHCDEALNASIKKGGGDKNPDIQEGAMMAFCNLSNNESNQTHVGASGAIKLAITTLETSDDPKVLRAAALACASMAHNSFVNKTRMGDQGAIKALLEVAIGRGMGGDHEEDFLDAKAAEACCLALATLLLNQLNQQILAELQAVEVFVQLVEETESMEVLAAGAMVVAALVPQPDAKKRLLCEGRMLPIEAAGGMEVLTRAKQWVYGRKTPPDWLLNTISIFGITEEEAIKEQRDREAEAERLVSEDLFLDNRAVSSGTTANQFQDEFFTHISLFREAVAEIRPVELDDDLVDMADKLF